MRRFFLTTAAAILGASASMLTAMNFSGARADSRHRINFDRVGPKSRRTGVAYPHSSIRQRARYARQIAAGQIKNAA